MREGLGLDARRDFLPSSLCPIPQFPITLCPSTGLIYLSPPNPQIAKKVGCPLDDTARMAKCLKITDTRALTLAYKMPLAGLEREWGPCVEGGPCS